MAAVPERLYRDRYWKPVLYLFDKHYKLKEHFTTKYFNFDTETIEVGKLQRAFGPYSHSEKIMFKLAMHLFNERHKFNLSDLDYLDSENKQLALEAMRMRFM